MQDKLHIFTLIRSLALRCYDSIVGVSCASICYVVEMQAR
jgi:hypothetical protein